MKPVFPPSSVLIINLGGMGDLMLSSGVFKTMRAALPDAIIDVLVAPRNKEFAQSYGLFNTVYDLPQGLTNAMRRGLELRSRHYDWALNMRTIVSAASALKMYLLFSVIGAKTRAGRDTDGRGFFFDVRVPETYIGRKQDYLYDADLIRALSITGPILERYIPVTETGRARAGALLNELNITPGDFVIGIHPGGQPSRRWPMENFAALAGRLIDGRKCKIVFTGSESEKELCRSVVKATGRAQAVECAGRLDVNGLAALMERINIFISNDTGAAHVAVCKNVPGIILFGPGQPQRYAPVDTSLYRSLYAGAACAPCEKERCDKLDCLRAISVEEVYKAAMQL